MAPLGLLLSEEALGVFIPLLVFWAYSGVYEALGVSMDKYRLFPREEEDKNLVSRRETLRGVLFNQACQVAFSSVLLWLQGKRDAHIPQPPLYAQAAQLLVAMLVSDAWQYFGHRLMHGNRFLYRHVHAHHHRLVVPYSYGSQYQHPLQALLLDTVGGGLAYAAAGMTPRTGMVFFSLLLIKSVDDHCGLWLRGHPFHSLFSNNSAFHTVHHQLYGGKANFSVSFFNFWDKLLGTYMPYTLEDREGGGFEVKPLKKD